METGSPAAKAGVRVGDVVLEVSGSRVIDAEDLMVRLRAYPAKTALRFQVWREGQTIDVALEPVEFPPELAESLAWDRLGIRVALGQGGARGGLVVRQVRPGSVAESSGLRAGDGVLRVNNAPVTGLDGFREALVAARGSASVLLLVQRGRYGYHLPLPF